MGSGIHQRFEGTGGNC
jgi:hypothetical protein